MGRLQILSAAGAANVYRRPRDFGGSRLDVGPLVLPRLVRAASTVFLLFALTLAFLSSSSFASSAFFAAAGVARGWGLDGDCLGGILRQYGAMPLSEGGPLSPAMNGLLGEASRRGRFLSASLATATLVFECALVPLALVLPLLHFQRRRSRRLAQTG